jgi:PEGA domain-containing protein
MEPIRAAASDGPILAFEDGFGRRYRANTDGDRHLEILCFHAELTEIPSFEFLLRERVNRLSGFQHACYARIAKVDRLKDGRGTLALFSEFAPGVRLAELIADSERRGFALDVNTALSVVQQVAAAAAALQQDAHMANGALGPERVIITPQGRPIILEYVVGVALEQLKYSRERYWRDLRVALPPSGGMPLFDQDADAMQLGTLALALLVGRLIQADEFPDKLEALVALACSGHAHDGHALLMPQLRSWLRRALQLDIRHSFKTAFEAKTELDTLLSGEDTSHALTKFLARYHGSPTATANRPHAAETSARTSTARLDLPGLTRFTPAPRIELAHTQSEPVHTQSEAEPLAHHADDRPIAKARTNQRRFSRRALLAASLVFTAMAELLFAGQRYFSPTAAHIVNGTLAVSTNPPGAQVIVDDQPRGRTPLGLSLPPGPHNLVVRGDGEPLTIPVTIVAGAASAQYVELPKAAATTAMLQVWSEPSGARVVIDGQPRGTTPLTVTDLASGEHAVVLENDLGAVNHTVMIVPGVPASLLVPMGTPQNAPASGWISVSAPVEMQLYEQGKLLGSTSVDRLMLSAGKHDIEIVSEPLGYRVTRSVQVSPGRVSPMALTLPTSVVSLNAIPWANVLIDGQSVGETPIGNLSVPIGPHEFVFRNPQLGEQHRAITVTLREPVRLSVDLTKK